MHQVSALIPADTPALAPQLHEEIMPSMASNKSTSSRAAYHYETERALLNCQRIAAVCRRETDSLNAKIAECDCPAERSKLLSERYNVQRLLQWAVSQEDRERDVGS